MDFRPFQPARRGGPLYAADLNRLMTSATEQAKLTGGPGVHVRRNAAGTQLAVHADKVVPLRVLSSERVGDYHRAKVIYYDAATRTWIDNYYCYALAPNMECTVRKRYVGLLINWGAAVTTSTTTDEPGTPEVDGVEEWPIFLLTGELIDSSCETTSTTPDPCDGYCTFGYSHTTKLWTQTASTCGEGCACNEPQACPDPAAPGTCTTEIMRTSCTSGTPAKQPNCTGTTTTAAPGADGCAAEGCRYQMNTRGSDNPHNWVWERLNDYCGAGCYCDNPHWEHGQLPIQYSPYICDPAFSSQSNCTPIWIDDECFRQVIEPLLGGGITAAEVECAICELPCRKVTTPEPTDDCGGSCRWVKDPDSGDWANYPPGGCTGDSADCHCEPPVAPPPGCTVAYTSCSGAQGPCGLCTYRWNDGAARWGTISSTCTGNCECLAPPPYPGTSACEIASVPCSEIHTTNPPTTSTTTSTTTPTPCGTCMWESQANGGWTIISYGCDAGCACYRPPEIPKAPGSIRITNCGPDNTTTTTLCPPTTTPAPGNCGYGDCSWQDNGTGWQQQYFCPRGCSCATPAPSCGAGPGSGPVYTYTRCSTCAPTTTPAPSCGLCAWGWYSQWLIDYFACSASCSCPTPSGDGDFGCNYKRWEKCVTTGAPCGGGECHYTCMLTHWSLSSTDAACALHGCGCAAQINTACTPFMATTAVPCT